jgi:hypothetical protein
MSPVKVAVLGLTVALLQSTLTGQNAQTPATKSSPKSATAALPPNQFSNYQHNSNFSPLTQITRRMSRS